MATLTTQYINISSTALWSETIGTSPGSLVTLLEEDWESVEETLKEVNNSFLIIFLSSHATVLVVECRKVCSRSPETS